MTALELLQSLNLLDETEHIEAKRASESGKSLLETVCAFANEPGLGGGWLMLGVAREEQALFPSYQVEGVAQPDKLCADLATQCRDTFNVPVRIELSTEQVNGQAVVLAYVPEAPAQDKPIFFKAQGLPKGALRRVGSVDQHCTDDDLAIFYQGRQRESFDASLLPDATLDELAPEALAASAALRRLRDAGLLVQKGKGSATYYLPAERLGLNKTTGESPGLSTHLDGLSGNPSALSSNPQSNAQDAARTILLDELPGSLAARLGSLGQRHPPQEIQNLIVDLCSLRDWSVSELALLLRRNPESIRQNYLRPLMRDGHLTMTNPEEPNDPQQAYRAV